MTAFYSEDVIMQTPKTLYKSAKALATRYPAFLSGIIIYSYLLFTIVHYLLKTKLAVPTFYDVFDTFDALPFMWFLSVALVKIIDVRSRLHQSETERILAQKQIELKETQLNTLHEVVKSLQHHINNPLAIISLTVGTARKQAKDSPDLLKQIDAIDESTQRIIRSMKEFFEAQSYQTEHIDNVVGSIASVPTGATSMQSNKPA
ncbi:MAG TPA: histidine kinase dimerization/phospho-acceptor domain-containing protein [Terriglobia bacterium]|nr:histidine kinase dimerization/phospho-acceptor domain-containing protein [Terriglobia bacterium]